MLKFVTLGDAPVGTSPLLARLTDQRFSTNPNVTVSACSFHPYASYGVLDVLGYWGWEDDGARVRCGIWKQIDIHPGRKKARLSNYNVRVRSPPRLFISSRAPVVVSLRISNLTVLMAL